MRFGIPALVFLVACVGDSPSPDAAGPDAQQGDGAVADSPMADGSTCAMPKMACSKGAQTVCTDVTTDDQNCGMCNNPCVAGTTCKTSMCTCTDVTKTLCGGSCVDTKTDPKNCGACGNVCVNNDCVIGKCDPIVFVTNALFNGNLGGFAGADMKCQMAAQAASLKGTYMAWVSQAPSSSPSARFTKSTQPYVLPDATLVANGWAALVSGNALAHAINMTELKATILGNTAVITNVAVDGTNQYANDCTGWTGVGTGPALCGNATATNLAWTRDFGSSAVICTTQGYRLYCFGQ